MVRPSNVVAVVAAAVLATAVRAQDPDRDKDGLSDFQEIHKYLTDPAKADSDGDGVPDGDWNERREFQYVVRVLVQVMRPVTIEHLCDDYQDARIVDATKDYVELEVFLYPLNTVGSAIAADRDWRRSAAAQAQWTKPGPTADWTPAMRGALRAALAKDGIDVDKLDDQTLVERVAPWLCRRAEHHDGFSTFVTAFDDHGKPFVPQELQDGAQRNEAASGVALAQQWQREISARGMFEQRVRGSCSSSAIYLNGCLRALGVPTRIVLCIPLIDANDDQELRLLEVGLTNHRIRRTITGPLQKLRGSWSSHTFNEVRVGGRWRRLNYERLGQDILDPGLFGLMTHVATFSDWADAQMPATIGRRQKLNLRNDVFGGANPYSTIALRDEFGPHCKIANELPGPGSATVTAVYWHDQKDLPDDVAAWFRDRQAFGLVARVEGLADADGLQAFLQDADLRVVLRAEGHPPLGVGFDAGCWWRKQDHWLIAVPFGGADRRDLVPGASYRFVPRNDGTMANWQVAQDLAIVRRTD